MERADFFFLVPTTVGMLDLDNIAKTRRLSTRYGISLHGQIGTFSVYTDLKTIGISEQKYISLSKVVAFQSLLPPKSETGENSTERCLAHLNIYKNYIQEIHIPEETHRYRENMHRKAAHSLNWCLDDSGGLCCLTWQSKISH